MTLASLSECLQQDFPLPALRPPLPRPHVGARARASLFGLHLHPRVDVVAIQVVLLYLAAGPHLHAVREVAAAWGQDEVVDEHSQSSPDERPHPENLGTERTDSGAVHRHPGLLLSRDICPERHPTATPRHGLPPHLCPDLEAGSVEAPCPDSRARRAGPRHPLSQDTASGPFLASMCPCSGCLVWPTLSHPPQCQKGHRKV